jgi:hypothetical protein
MILLYREMYYLIPLVLSPSVNSRKRNNNVVVTWKSRMYNRCTASIVPVTRVSIRFARSPTPYDLVYRLLTSTSIGYYNSPCTVQYNGPDESSPVIGVRRPTLSGTSTDVLAFILKTHRQMEPSDVPIRIIHQRGKGRWGT